MIRFARNLPLAALLMAGIMAFSYGASRWIACSSPQVAHILKARAMQTAEVSP